MMITIAITHHTPGVEHSAELDMLVAQIAAAVEAAGGTPLLVAPDWDEAELRRVYNQADGVILSGGGDIDPGCYGKAPVPSVGGVDPNRDRTEMAVARWAIEEAKPLLGICRGLQMLNVVMGGTLFRDMSECAGAQPHTFYPGYPYDLRAHPVEITPDTLLARSLGTAALAVNSLHHQACDAVAPGLCVAARAPDGVVEALEVPGHPFALAVQWHPEALPDMPASGAIFGALVEASRRG